MVVGAQFFRQNTWFLKNNRALPKFLCGILHYLISITKLSKKSVHISQFCINHLNHLNVWLVSDQGPLVLELRTLPLTALKLTADQLSLTVATAFVAAERLRRMVTMTANTCNPFHNILRLFDVLPNFAFTTNATMRNYYL